MLDAVTLRDKALSLGFDLVGAARAGPAAHAGFFLKWCERGSGGEMAYMARSADARADTRTRFPWGKSIVAVAMSYGPSAFAPGGQIVEKQRESSRLLSASSLREKNTPPKMPRYAPAGPGPDKSGRLLDAFPPVAMSPSDAPYGRVSCYAWGDDYHTVMSRPLAELEKFLKYNGAAQAKSYVDTGPILERDWAASAGLGWIGKNTMLINQRLGSWLFLGVIATDLELLEEQPHPDRCGTCNRCIDACPTGALLGPHVLDPRLCISYLTIELKGVIPPRLRPLIGNYVFGCDICQSVCPWNSKVPAADRPDFRPRPGLDRLDIEWALSHPDALAELVAGTGVERALGQRLTRNIIVAAGNSGDPRLIRALEPYAVGSSPYLAEHAEWALKRLRSP
jgi:epoxyqueuosine reductase